MQKSVFFSYFNICTFYIVIWCLYGFHWYEVVPQTTIDSVLGMLIGVNLLISFWCFLKINGRRKPYLFKYINILLLTFTIYGIFYLLFGQTYYVNGNPVSKASYIISFYRSFLSVYAFYYFANKGFINERTIKVYLLLIIITYLGYDFFYSQRIISTSIYGSDFTNNLGYIFLFLMPAALFFQKTTLRLGVLFIALACVLISMKRGAILIGSLLFVWILIGEYRTSSKQGKFWLIVLALAIVGYSTSFFVNFFEDNDFAQARIEQTLEGDSSGRDRIYGSLLTWYTEDANIIQQMIGNGPDASLGINGRDAHNDWLDLLCCQGLVGVLLYLTYWIVFFRTWRSMKRKRLIYFVVGSVFLIQFIRSLISMSYATLPTCGALLLGYCLSINYNSKLIGTKRLE